MIEGNVENVERMKNNLSCLNDSFYWADTPQGFDYWKEVYKNLKIVYDNMKIAIEKMKPKICSKCGQEIKE